jgi:hypothetical protein
MKTLAALSIATLVAACASKSAYMPERFLQIRSQAPDAVLAQITLQNGPECDEVLDRIRYDVGTRIFPGATASCFQTSAEATLPFRATLQNKRIPAILEIATPSLERCQEAITIARKAQIRADEVDVIRPCQQVANR